jgi:hypothetical protein
MPDVFALSHLLTVMKNRRLASLRCTADITGDDVLTTIIAGRSLTTCVA